MADQSSPERDLSPVKRALIEQRRLKTRLEEQERAQREPIAIVGIGCRFPGADGPEAFWNLLKDGVDAIREVPADRWDVNALYDPDPDAPGRVATRWGGFLDRVDLFDPQFFGISPREAAAMDPQQRLTLEVAWEALEHAAQPFEKLAGSLTGVFLGVGTNDYLQLQTRADRQENFDAYLATGNSHSVAAGRVSYVLGLQGPSLAVDTACSSSLVAVHLACQSLRAGDCRMALAGGVNTLLWDGNTISLSKAHMMARDGRCKTFDAAADGFVRAEGCGIVVLKRLSDAEKDGDTIIAAILGSACNQDGRSSGLTAPNGPSQEAAISRALERAQLDPSAIGYVETHGTGTSLGDPIEVRALGNVLCKGRGPDEPLIIGSVKTNIGHLEAAAGIAGLIKTALCVHYGEIAPHLHFKTPNPHIPWEDYRLLVPVTGRKWNTDRTRIAGVSGFGFNGTNAHVIVGQAPEPRVPQTELDRPLHLLALSAKNPEALRALAARHLELISKAPDLNIADVCFTLNVGRAHMDVRAALTAKSIGELRAGLAKIAGEQRSLTVGEPTSGQIAFLFTGQGSQYAGMGRELYQTQPTFRKTMDRCAGLLRPLLDRPPLEVMFETSAELNQTIYTQPALFALEYSLYELWKSWGVEPSAVLGHSVGEYVAACVAGVFSLEDGLKLIAARARLMQGLVAGGAMAVVFAGEREVRDRIEGTGLSIAALNGPANTVISGAEAGIEAALARFAKAGIQGTRLAVSHAFHSSLMEPMLEEFERVAAQVSYRRPKLALMSNLTGRMAEGEEVCGSRYWRRQVREAVRFEEGIRGLVEQGIGTMVEMGPQPVLIGMGKQCVAQDAANWVSTLRRGREDWAELMEAVSRLYLQGIRIDWEGFDRDYPRRRLRLPTYPFQRQRYWIDDPGKPTPPGSWPLAVQSASRQADQVPIDLNLSAFPAKWSAFERLTEARIAASLRAFGLFLREDETHSVEDALHSAGIRESYRSLLTRWLDRLVRKNWLERDNHGYVSRKPLPAPDLEQALAEVRSVWADSPLLLNYVERCCAGIENVLRGRSSPLEMLFPAGSFETAEFLYETWALPRYFNGIVRSALEPFARNAALAGRTLRVLEAGAGTGSTTGSALAALAGSKAEYWFTDLSDLFLSRAQRKFSTYDFVRYQIFDLDRDPAEQGVPDHAFDVIVAANVLHATRDLNQTLQRVRSLLVSGGVLLAFEVTEHLPWFDITVALIEGWRKHAEELRREHPLLKPEKWTELLLQHGFDAVEALPYPGSPAGILGHHVLIARGPKLEHKPAGTKIDAPESHRRNVAADGTKQEAARFLAELETFTESERDQALVEFIRGHIADVIRLDRSKIGRTQRLTGMGIDSLMAIEIAARLTAGLDLKTRLPSTLVFDHATIQGIAAHIDHVVLRPSRSEVKAPSPARISGIEQSLAELSEEEAEQLLLAKLKDLE